MEKAKIQWVLCTYLYEWKQDHSSSGISSGAMEEFTPHVSLMWHSPLISEDSCSPTRWCRCLRKEQAVCTLVWHSPPYTFISCKHSWGPEDLPMRGLHLWSQMILFGWLDSLFPYKNLQTKTKSDHWKQPGKLWSPSWLSITASI